MLMKALVMEHAGGAKLEKVEKPKPPANHALIRVIRAGICNTDTEILKGYMGYHGILGHEFVGEVVEVPEGSGFSEGDRVVGEINLSCGDCEFCNRGGIAKRNHCKKRTVLGILNKDGSFAEYITLPVENLHAVPDSISSRDAAFAEPLAAAFRVVEQIKWNTSDKVAIIGDGKLGILITMVMATQPVEKLVLFGKHPDKMHLVPENVTCIQVEDTSGAVYEDQFDKVIEASGSPSGIILAGAIIKPLGTIVLKTTCAATASSLNTAPFVIKEVNIVGSRCGNFEMALKALESGEISVEQLITAEYSLENAERAIQHAAKKGILKVQLIMDPRK